LPIERSTIRLKLADEQAARPLLTFKPTEPNDVEKVDVIGAIWDFVWNEADTDREIEKLKLTKNIFGT
jgi:hypothetical protein